MTPGVELNIDKELWKEYQKFCIDCGKSASSRVQEFMRKELEDVDSEE